jgi:3-methyladenine DNA glycosylase AlkD
MTALIIMTFRYKKEPTLFYKLYLKNRKHINNWDLVDVTCPKIVGDYLLDKPRDILYKLAKSKNLWEKRIAIIATAMFIRNGEFEDTLKIAEILLRDKHDLIHKAVGWMLREVGKKNVDVEKKFLNKYYKVMPRTMLRYAIEKFPENERKSYLTGLIKN